jgi:hypothetical protein
VSPPPSSLSYALQQIAHGRFDNGRPLSAALAQQIARNALSAKGIDWSKAALQAAELRGEGAPTQ